MRAWARNGRFVLEDVPSELVGAVAELSFDADGATWVRSFPADAPYAARASEHFVASAARLVRQAAGLERVPWDETLELLLDRTRGEDWWLVGSTALAVRGLPVEPRDVDLISDTEGADRLAAAVADLLVEPLSDGGYLGERWLRAFAGSRFECVGGVHAAVDDGDGPSDFGPVAASRLETVEWRGHLVRVPPLELQLQVSERRGLAERARMIRSLLDRA